MPKKTNRAILYIMTVAVLLGTLSGCSRGAGGDKVSETDIPASETDMDDDGESNTTGDGKFALNCDRSASFNPFSTSNVFNIMVTQLMYDTMISVNQNFACNPGLVTSWESNNGYTWYFKVDNTVTFWDGTTLTAKDVSYSLQRAKQSPQFKSRLRIVTGISAVDENTFVVNISYPNTQFPSFLDIPVIKYGTVGEAVPLGTGPYTIDEECTKLTSYEGHKEAAPIKNIYLREFTQVEDIISGYESGDIDIVTNDPSGNLDLGYGSVNDIRQYPTTNMHYLGFNSKSLFFSNPLSRRAMTYVVDRESIVNDIMGGWAAAAALPMSPTSSLYNTAYSDLISYSIKKSQDAFDEAEIQDYNDDGIRSVMVTGIPVETGIDFIVCSESPEKLEAAKMIAGNLRALGINVTLRELSFSDFQYALNTGDFDMFYAEVKLTPDFSIRNLVFKGSGLNYGRFEDSGLEEHISKYMASSEETRQYDADMMFKYVTDFAPIIPICFEKHQVISHRGIISSAKPTQYNTFCGVGQWEIEPD